jgi:predicted acyltransferase
VTAQRERLLALDVFRGATVAGMLLVNNPGNWGAIYPASPHTSRSVRDARVAMTKARSSGR